MVLSTFGAIVGFAAEVARQTQEVYGVMAAKANNPELRDTLQLFEREERKIHSLMETARRENITEMILEPVAGLEQKDYEIDPALLEQTGDQGLLRTAILLEERGRKFFSDAASKVPLPEVARIFRKVAKKKEENLSKLPGFGLNETLRKRTGD